MADSLQTLINAAIALDYYPQQMHSVVGPTHGCKTYFSRPVLCPRKFKFTTVVAGLNGFPAWSTSCPRSGSALVLASFVCCLSSFLLPNAAASQAAPPMPFRHCIVTSSPPDLIFLFCFGLLLSSPIGCLWVAPIFLSCSCVGFDFVVQGGVLTCCRPPLIVSFCSSCLLSVSLPPS